MKMHDLGEKPPEQPTEAIGPEGKREKYYPSVHLTSKQLPTLGDKKIGSRCNLHIVGEITGIRKNEDETSYDVELKEAGIGSAVSKGDYDKMSDDDKDKEDKEEVLGEEE